ARPLGELRAFEVVLQVLDVGQPGELLQAEEARTGGADEGRVGHAGDAGDVLQGLDVRGAGVEVVVGDQRAHRLAAELAVLGGVDVLVQAGLDHLGAVLEILQQVLLGGVEDLQLDVLAEVGALHQQLQAAPGRLQRLELRMVEDLVHLLAEGGVDLGDHAIDQRLLHRLVVVLRLEQLGDEGGDAALGDVVGLVGGVQPGFGDDALENAGVGGGGAVGGGGCGRGHRWGFLVGAQASRPSSLSTRSRACGSASTLSMALRKAGALPRGPFRATSASRRAISFFSSGTCSTRLAGLKSFMESMRNCTARSSPASSRRRLGTLKVRFSSCLASTSSKLFLSMPIGLRSSVLRSSARWVKSPSTSSLRGSSCSSWALPVAGLKVTLMRSLGATEPSLAIASLLACSVQRRVEIEAAQAAVQRFLAFAQPLLLVAAMQLAGDGQGQARLPALQVVRLQLLIQRFEQRPGQLVAAG